MKANETITISKGNSKMGAIPSVSLPPIVTCKNCGTCAKKCYAAKLCRLYPSVKASYEKMIFSLPFDGCNIDNPHNLPTAAVILKGRQPKDDYKICGGNCTECACRGVGCWELKKGETIAFYEH